MSSLIEVLMSNRDKQVITLPVSNDCESFWSQLSNDMYYCHTLEEIGMDYSVKEALNQFAKSDSLELVNRQGRLLKRFAKFWKEQKGEKLSDSIQGIIGDRLQYYVQHEVQHNEYVIDFTNCIDWSDGYFGKSGSCWWGTYQDSIPTFENGGGWAIRFYDSLEDTNGIGRTWILPFGNVLLCFNSYGVERPQVSKVIKRVFLAHGVELHYKKVHIYNGQDSTIPYINDGTGFVLYPDGIETEDEYDVNLEVIEDNEHVKCDGCGSRMDYEDSIRVGDNDYCQDCVNDRFSYCDRCEEYCDQDDVHRIVGHSRYECICRYCAESIGAELCESCHCYSEDTIDTDDTEETRCENCRGDLTYCESCDEWYENGHDCPDDEDEDESDYTPEEVERDFISCNLETVSLASGRYTAEQETLQVYRHENISGLFVIYKDEGYSVTHETSGMAIVRNIQNVHSALNFMETISPLANWSRTADSLENDSSLMNQLLRLKRELL